MRTVIPYVFEKPIPETGQSIIEYHGLTLKDFGLDSSSITIFNIPKFITAFECILLNDDKFISNIGFPIYVHVISVFIDDIYSDEDEELSFAVKAICKLGK